MATLLRFPQQRVTALKSADQSVHLLRWGDKTWTRESGYLMDFPNADAFRKFVSLLPVVSAPPVSAPPVSAAPAPPSRTFAFPKDLIWDKGYGGRMTLPKGRYYIGDLCYFMEDGLYQTVWGHQFRFDSGCYHGVSASDPTKRFYLDVGTTDGDGSFKDAVTGTEFCVDAGNIGICSLELAEDYEDAVKVLSKAKKGTLIPYQGGALCDFTEDVRCDFEDCGERYRIYGGYNEEVYIKRGYRDDADSEGDW